MSDSVRIKHTKMKKKFEAQKGCPQRVRMEGGVKTTTNDKKSICIYESSKKNIYSCIVGKSSKLYDVL